MVFAVHLSNANIDCKIDRCIMDPVDGLGTRRGEGAWRPLRARRQRTQGGNRVRVIAQLIVRATVGISGPTGSIADLTDIFAVQDELTQDVQGVRG
jgi:hypothetical protein